MDDPKLVEMIASLSTTATRLSGLSGDLGRLVRQRDRQLDTMLSDLNRASEYLKQFARAIRERPSLLLHGETLKEKDLP